MVELLQKLVKVHVQFDHPILNVLPIRSDLCSFRVNLSV